MTDSLIEAYRRFVPEQFLKYMRKNAITDVRLGDHAYTDMTVLFSDIRSFTTLSERLTPDENFRFLNSYLSKMEPSVHLYGGFIDKFIGDSIMALFGPAPEDALLSSLDMLTRLRDYNLGRLRAGYEPIRIGIGLNSGPVMLGIVGGEGRMEGTVIGDTVNLASRIEGLNKRYGTTLLLSGNTVARLKAFHTYGMRKIDSVRVRGRQHIETIYECFECDPPEIYEKKLCTNEQFEEALRLYEQGLYSEAKETFREVYERNRYDLISRHYMERCDSPPMEEDVNKPRFAACDFTENNERLTKLLRPKVQLYGETGTVPSFEPGSTAPPIAERFAEAAVIYFEHHLNLRTDPASFVWSWEPECELRDLTACIYMRGSMEGALLISADLTAGLALLHRMSYGGWTTEEEIPLLLDTIGEALNGISGNALSMFGHFSDFVTIDPPIALQTNSASLRPKNGVWRCTLHVKGEPVTLLTFE